MNARTVRRLAARLTCLTAATVVAVGLAATPAQAKWETPTLRAPQMRLDILELGTAFRVCGYGTATTAGTWTLDIDGERSDGTLISQGSTTYGTSTASCLTVYQYATLSGEFRVVFTFTDPSGDGPGVVVGGGSWDLLTGQHSWDTA